MLFLNKLKEPKYLIKILIIAVVYFITAKFGLSLAGTTEQITLVWPATGIAIASLLLFGLDSWPAIVIGAFFANLYTHETVPVALMISIGNALEAYVSTYLLFKFHFDLDLEHFKDVLLYVLFAGLVGPSISAFIGTVSLSIGGFATWSNFPTLWVNWWLGDAIGALVITPVIIVRRDLKKYLQFNLNDFIATLILTSTVLFICIMVFTPLVLGRASNYPLAYLIFPVLILSSLRFKQIGSTWKVLLISVIAIWGTINGYGQFVIAGNVQLSLLFLQIYIGIIAVTCLIYSSIVDERDKSIKDISLSEEKFRNLIENSTGAIILINKEGNVTYASPSIEKMLGYTPEEYIGKSGFDIIVPEDIQNALSQFAKILEKDNNTFKFSFKIKRKDGQIRWLEGIAKNLLNNPAVKAVVGNYDDVTDHKKIDIVKSEFVSLAAHQLRSPLTTLRWYSESMTNIFEKNNTKLIQYSEQIHTTVLKMTSLVNLLLNVSRVELGTFADKPEKTDFVKIARDSVKIYMPEILKKNIKFNQEYSDDKIDDYIDPGYVSIIFENLISNAVKYTPDMGKVNLNVNKNDNDIKIDIEDNGVGIPEYQKLNIFTKLFRADNVKKIVPDGTGLGLYLVKAVVDKLKGNISFKSVENKGTTFYITLPIRNEK